VRPAAHDAPRENSDAGKEPFHQKTFVADAMSASFSPIASPSRFQTARRKTSRTQNGVGAPMPNSYAR